LAKEVGAMIISEIDLYEKLKEKLGEEESKALVEFLKQQAQSEVRLLADEILQKIDNALNEMKGIEEESIERVKEIVVNAINEALEKVEKDIDAKLGEIENKLSKLDTAVEKLDSLESKISEIANKVDQINAKTGGVKGLMFFLWLLLVGTVIFNILLNIPQTRDAILKAISGGAH
jgi:DNA repair exonuclease SbcCD ATPase subunit